MDSASASATQEEMEKVMGFASFGSTKGKQIPGNESAWGMASPAGSQGQQAEDKGEEKGLGGVGVKKKAGDGPAEERELEELGRKLRRVIRVAEETEEAEGDAVEGMLDLGGR